MNKNLNLSTIRMVKDVEKDYIKFMDIASLPEYIIKPIDTESAKKDGHLFVSFGERVPVFNIDNTYTSVLKSNSKPGIYHELTHILDNSILLPDITLEERIPITKMYTEYHAMQIQMKAALRFYSNNEENYKFKFSTKVHDWFDNKNVKEDIIYKTIDFLETIKSIVSNHGKGFLFKLLLHSVYYLSQIDFWNQYCAEDVSEYIVGDIFDILYGNEFDIYKSYLIGLKNTHTHFRILDSIGDNIIKHCEYNKTYNLINEIEYKWK